MKTVATSERVYFVIVRRDRTIQMRLFRSLQEKYWIPACAGMTVFFIVRLV